MRTICEYTGPNGRFTVECNRDGSPPYVVRNDAGELAASFASPSEENAAKDKCRELSGWLPSDSATSGATPEISGDEAGPLPLRA